MNEICFSISKKIKNAQKEQMQLLSILFAIQIKIFAEFIFFTKWKKLANYKLNSTFAPLETWAAQKVLSDRNNEIYMKVCCKKQFYCCFGSLDLLVCLLEM